MERFRSRIKQSAFSCPGFKVPQEDDEGISDDILVETVKKLLDERTEARDKVREMKDNVKGLENTKKELKNSSKTLKQHLSTMEVSVLIGLCTIGCLEKTYLLNF